MADMIEVPDMDIREELELRRISQSEFAKLVGVNRVTIGKWIATGKIPHLQYLGIIKAIELWDADFDAKRTSRSAA